MDVDPLFTGSFTSAVALNGKMFNEVLQLQRDTGSIKRVGIYKIWLSKQNGLIGYEHYPTLERWVKE